MDAAKAAGKKPDRSDLSVMMSAQVKLNDQAGAQQTLEISVSNYTTPTTGTSSWVWR